MSRKLEKQLFNLKVRRHTRRTLASVHPRPSIRVALAGAERGAFSRTCPVHALADERICQCRRDTPGALTLATAKSSRRAMDFVLRGLTCDSGRMRTRIVLSNIELFYSPPPISTPPAHTADTYTHSADNFSRISLGKKKEKYHEAMTFCR